MTSDALSPWPSRPMTRNGSSVRWSPSSASAPTAAGCRRRAGTSSLDIVVRARQPADPPPQVLGLGAPQLRDRRLARRGVHAHRREVEEALDRAALGVDVLHAPDRHERAPLDEQPVPQVELVVADLVPPAPPEHE